MFDKIVLHQSAAGGLTLGEIAEALLFYRRVHIVLDVFVLWPLLDTLGERGLVELLSRDEVSAVYVEDMLMTLSGPLVGGGEWHEYAGATLNPGGYTNLEPVEFFRYLLAEVGHRPRDEANTLSARGGG